MNINFKKTSILLIAGALLGLSCKKDEKKDPEPKTGETAELHHIAFAVGSGSSSPTYVQAHENFGEGKSISYNGYGFEVPATRTARIFANNNGSSLYDLDYGGGRIYKFDAAGGETYSKVSETNVEFAVGTAYPRWTQLNDEYAMVHYVATENVVDEESGKVTYKKATARVVLVSLDNLTMQTVEEFEIPRSEANGTDYVGRMDAPVVLDGKIYYGISRIGFDPLNPEAGRDERPAANNTNVETLVMDFPSLTNPKLISTTAGGAKGATNGYRGPVCHIDENNDIYQIVSTLEDEDDTFILKISNGDYDDSYSFNLTEAIGQEIGCNTWFYVGNGIAYVPYERVSEDVRENWSVARVDIYNKTAVTLNLPSNLWLQQFQSGALIDGKFHMPIAPIGGQGNVYIFDPASSSADGFTKGAKLQTGADSYYIGIY